MGRRVALSSKIALLVMSVLAAVAVTANPGYAADDAAVYIVQGLPGDNVNVSVDGHSLAKGLKTAAVVGPFKVRPGQRKVTFSDGTKVVLTRTFPVTARSSWDVVVHLPAPTANQPVVTVFRNDTSSVPNGKAALTVAHTASVGPADIRVNGKPLFDNVANGQSLNLVVPVATYQVGIVPHGHTKPVLVGPLSLTVQGGALNRVYAIGDPKKKTMNVAVHVIETGYRGTARPTKINTGTGGQAVGADPSVVVTLTP